MSLHRLRTGRLLSFVSSLYSKIALSADANADRVTQLIGGRAYKECSALKIEGVDDVFEAATRLSMLMREGVPAHVRNDR
jgi:hypothetical protein